ncbi:MAG: hypothetical protein ISS48_04075 [Candidatus Aenigmarchaeota archaeon]|nr:hypothetical protein [Candidatus Aenigmarchaeota archaeon]
MIENNTKKRILEEVVEAAKKKTTIPYGILASRVGLISQPNWFHIIGSYLFRINKDMMEKDKKVPLLSAIVVKEGEEEVPGDGFWECAYQLGRWDGNTNKFDFLKMEKEAVWNYDWDKI